MSTKNEICTQALSLLKYHTNAFDFDNPKDKAEEACKMWYYSTLRELFEREVFDIAVRRAKIPQEVLEEQAFGNEARYRLPADFIRCLAINGCEYQRVSYKIENGFLYFQTTFTTEENMSIDLLYVSSDIDESRIRGNLQHAFVNLLAARICTAISSDSTRVRDFENQAENYIHEAKIHHGYYKEFMDANCCLVLNNCGY